MHFRAKLLRAVGKLPYLLLRGACKHTPCQLLAKQCCRIVGAAYRTRQRQHCFRCILGGQLAVINGRPPPLEGHILAGLGQKPGGESQPVAYLVRSGHRLQTPRSSAKAGVVAGASATDRRPVGARGRGHGAASDGAAAPAAWSHIPADRKAPVRRGRCRDTEEGTHDSNSVGVLAWSDTRPPEVAGKPTPHEEMAVQRLVRQLLGDDKQVPIAGLRCLPA